MKTIEGIIRSIQKDFAARVGGISSNWTVRYHIFMMCITKYYDDLYIVIHEKYDYIEEKSKYRYTMAKFKKLKKVLDISSDDEKAHTIEAFDTVRDGKEVYLVNYEWTTSDIYNRINLRMSVYRINDELEAKICEDFNNGLKYFYKDRDKYNKIFANILAE